MKDVLDERMSEQPARLRLVAVDLDGTLLRSDLTISERTRAALRAARAAGIAQVAVTARPPRRVRELAEALGLAGLAICTNGALLYDLDRDAVVSQSRLTAERAAALIARLRVAAPGVAFAVEIGVKHGSEHLYRSPVEHGADWQTGQRSIDVIELCREGVTKLIVQDGQHSLEALLALVSEHAGDHAHVTHSGSAFVEVSAAGVTNASALAVYCSERGIAAREVVAFGDMPDDAPMLAWAGCGVAVANAHPDLLAVADRRTASNDEDGVAVLLEELAARDYFLSARGA